MIILIPYICIAINKTILQILPKIFVLIKSQDREVIGTIVTPALQLLSHLCSEEIAFLVMPDGFEVFIYEFGPDAL